MIKPEEEQELKEKIIGAKKDSIALSIVSDFMDKCKPLNNVDGVNYDYKRRLKGSTIEIKLSFFDDEGILKEQKIKVQRHDIMVEKPSAN